MTDEIFWVDPKLQKIQRIARPIVALPLIRSGLKDDLREEIVFGQQGPICLGAAMDHLVSQPGSLLPEFSTMQRFEFVSYIALIELEGVRHVLHAIWRAGFLEALAAGVTAYPYNKERIWGAGTHFISQRDTSE
jgi:hypothetical protein